MQIIFNGCKLSPVETICMKRQLLFSGKNKRRYFNMSRLKIIPRVPSDKLRYTMILTSLQTIHTPLQIVQIQIRGLITSRLIRIYTVCHSVIDFWLKHLFAIMDVSKFPEMEESKLETRDERVKLKNWDLQSILRFHTRFNFSTEKPVIVFHQKQQMAHLLTQLAWSFKYGFWYLIYSVFVKYNKVLVMVEQNR